MSKNPTSDFQFAVLTAAGTPDPALAIAGSRAGALGILNLEFTSDRDGSLVALAALTNGRIAASGGAAPVFQGDEMIGAYGISGGTSQQDEEMALYARAKVGWAHQPQNDTTDAGVKSHVNELYAQAGITDRKL